MQANGRVLLVLFAFNCYTQDFHSRDRDALLQLETTVAARLLRLARASWLARKLGTSAAERARTMHQHANGKSRTVRVVLAAWHYIASSVGGVLTTRGSRSCVPARTLGRG
jgi:hypothetical protein